MIGTDNSSVGWGDYRESIIHGSIPDNCNFFYLGLWKFPQENVFKSFNNIKNRTVLSKAFNQLTNKQTITGSCTKTFQDSFITSFRFCEN